MVKLRHKLFLVVFVFSVLVYAVLGGTLYFSLFDYFQTQEDSYLKTIGELCVKSIKSEPEALQNLSLLRTKVRSCQPTDQNLNLYFRIQNDQRQTVFNSFPQMYEPFLYESFEESQNEYQLIRATNFFSIQLLSIEIKDESQRYGSLFIGKRKTTWLMLLSKARSLVVANGAVAFLFLIVLSAAFTFLVSRPLESVHRFVTQRKADPNVPLPKLAKDEIGQLGADFYTLISDLEGKDYIENYVQTLTHEIKSPLTGIQSAGEILKQDITKEERDFFTDQIESETSRLHSIIERMLALTNLEHGKQSLIRENVSFREICIDIRTKLATSLAAKKLTLSLPTEDWEINVDRNLFESAIQNIVENAIEFSSEENTIELKVHSSNGEANIVVSDNGPGIPDYALDKVFDRFYSLPRPESGKKSSGLGLCFSKQIIELHGGSLKISNKPAPQHGVIVEISLV